MSRRDDLTPDDRRIWARVAGSVTPAVRKKALRITPGALEVEPPPAPHPTGKAKPRPAAVLPPSAVPAPASAQRSRGVPEELEPRRKRRLSRERDPIEARIDLHGYGRFQAQDALTAFLMGAQARGYRAVLVVTGQGRRGGTGIIRASVGEWLQSPALRGVVSGFAPAARQHGGDGALYVTIRRG
ncbi:Smr/MutS family protein [Brevundimonas sp. Root1279]|uniref:Smr/MutS family protein n=1 Tax=Brevundimonas sp. Root1279 TaxID=1736443 RepID=UPI0006F2170C|nr:Smr/MutS family protein [Brevundimonas sp. Root1279]KQW86509.1 DNA mismatch repair protein MutS [Brevundimonas sp. Root1279]